MPLCRVGNALRPASTEGRVHLVPATGRANGRWSWQFVWKFGRSRGITTRGPDVPAESSNASGDFLVTRSSMSTPSAPPRPLPGGSGLLCEPQDPRRHRGTSSRPLRGGARSRRRGTTFGPASARRRLSRPPLPNCAAQSRSLSPTVVVVPDRTGVGVE